MLKTFRILTFGFVESLEIRIWNLSLFSPHGLGQVVKPSLLEGNPPSGNEGNGSKPQGEGLFSLISIGQVEENGIRPIVVVSGEEDPFHSGKGNLQIDLFTTLSLGYLKEQHIPFEP
jgi:hypothetical protein